MALRLARRPPSCGPNRCGPMVPSSAPHPAHPDDGARCPAAPPLRGPTGLRRVRVSTRTRTPPSTSAGCWRTRCPCRVGACEASIVEAAPPTTAAATASTRIHGPFRRCDARGGPDGASGWKSSASTLTARASGLAERCEKVYPLTTCSQEAARAGPSGRAAAALTAADRWSRFGRPLSPSRQRGGGPVDAPSADEGEAGCRSRWTHGCPRWSGRPPRPARRAMNKRQSRFIRPAGRVPRAWPARRRPAARPALHRGHASRRRRRSCPRAACKC